MADQNLLPLEIGTAASIATLGVGSFFVDGRVPDVHCLFPDLKCRANDPNRGDGRRVHVTRDAGMHAWCVAPFHLVAEEESMVDFTKLGQQMDKLRHRREEEAKALEIATSIPPLQARPLDGIPDWTSRIGVLYGTPAKVGEAWGVAIHPTVQQTALLEIEMRKQIDNGNHDADVLRGREAVSIDRSGRVRMLTITDGSRGFVYDMYGNNSARCARVERTIERPPLAGAHPGIRRLLSQPGELLPLESDPQVTLPEERPVIPRGENPTASRRGYTR